MGPIRSDDEHEAAIAETAQLWRSALGTPDGDRPNALVTVVAAYEHEHHAMDPPDPDAAIRFRREQAGQPAIRG